MRTRDKKREAFFRYWGITSNPFTPGPANDNFYLSKNHEEALERLLYLAESEGTSMGMLTGEVGSGKTSIRYQFKKNLPSDSFRVVSFTESNLKFPELLKRIIEDLAGRQMATVKATELQLVTLFKKLLVLKGTSQSKKLVLAIDEAQELSAECFRGLKMLGNVTCDTGSEMTTLLIGQPELLPRIRKLPEIEGRIALYFHLDGLQQAEAGEYISHRLKAVGHPDGKIMNDECVRMMAEASQGLPRHLNRLAALVLDHAFALNTEISPRILGNVIRDFEKQCRILRAA